jgi:three-Cys-motif partner protein
MDVVDFDEIGYWSEVKLDIIRDYAKAYSKILTTQKRPQLHHVYIDGFAGCGHHRSKTTGQVVPGSPLNALEIEPQFKEYYLVDLNRSRAQRLEEIARNQNNVHVFNGDCNEVLLEQVFPKVRYEDYKRGLCLLDPYGLHLNWLVIKRAGEMKSIEIFLNFPVMDINMNVLWHNPSAVNPRQAERMDAFWGDQTWRDAAYTSEQDLFGEVERKKDIKVVAAAFRKRLLTVAGFKHVPEPVPMRNSKGAIVYYLYFASHKPVAADIVADIFRKYRNHGVT